MKKKLWQFYGGRTDPWSGSLWIELIDGKHRAKARRLRRAPRREVMRRKALRQRAAQRMPLRRMWITDQETSRSGWRRK